MKHLFLGLIVFITCTSMCLTKGAHTFYVDQSNKTPSYPFTNSASAATNILDALTASYSITQDVVVIRVAHGEYRESGTLMLTNAVTVTLSGDQGATFTTIDAQNLHRAVYLNSNAVIQGFTITRGSGVSQGAGIYMNNGGIARHCKLTNNSASQHGGAVYISQLGLVVNCTLSDNSASVQGGAIQCNFGGIIRNSIIYSNTANYGGGVFFYRGGVLENCTICDNTASSGGGGLRNDTVAGGGTAVNTIFYYNTPDNCSGAAPNIFTNCCMTPPVDGPGHITNEPLFMARTSGDYHLSRYSPCMDAGTDNIYYSFESDPDGHPRELNIMADIGAYEYDSPLLTPNFSTKTITITNGSSVVFGAFAIGNHTDLTYFQWDFDGDMTWDEEGTDLDNATNTYYTPGTYTVRLGISNTVGEYAVRTKQQYVTVQAPRLYVALNGYTTPPYSSWTHPAQTIQTAIDAASPGAIILVSNGTYDITSHIIVDKPLTIESVNGPNESRIDAQYPLYSNRCLYITSTGITINGFTLKNGYAANGGGVYTTTNTILKNCIIQNNRATGQGGGGYLNGVCTLTNCHVSYNRANSSGGGLYINSKNSVFAHGIINSNHAQRGGGVYCLRNGLIKNSMISSNYVSVEGAGIFFDRGGVVHDSLIYKNYAVHEAGGVYLSQSGLVERCTICYNRGEYGGGVYLPVTGGIVRCSIITSNTLDNHGDGIMAGVIEYCCTRPLPSASNNFTNDPHCINMPNHDYRLMAVSPCIDAGPTGTVQAIDYIGIPRPIDGENDGVNKYDVGAYEYLNASSDSDGDGIVDNFEINSYHTSPLNADSDGDLLDDADEVLQGTDPLNQDSDHDGISDGTEIAQGLDPLAIDSDNDGLTDEYELTNSPVCNPLVADTDSDGLTDGYEIQYGCAPNETDTDADAQTDYEEVYAGTDPTDIDEYFSVWEILNTTNQMIIQWDGITNRFYNVYALETLEGPQNWLPVDGLTWIPGSNRTINASLGATNVQAMRISVMK